MQSKCLLLYGQIYFYLIKVTPLKVRNNMSQPQIKGTHVRRTFF